MTFTLLRRRLLALAAAGALLAVALGAFGTHGLEQQLSADRLNTWETATRYLMWHALAVIALSSLQMTTLPLAALLTGAFLFSLALYLWVLTGIAWLPVLAPLGGLCMLTGWALTIRSFLVRS